MSPPSLRSIAVFCGSNFGFSDVYREAAVSLGQEIAKRGLILVYGGTNKGLMGVLADTVLECGGSVSGVINRRLFERGHLHPHLTHHDVVDNMRERKARMASLADAFVALPGGLGTLEELFEAATLTQLGDHHKACGALNVRGFFDPMMAMLNLAVQEGFMKDEHRDMLVLDTDAASLLDRVATWKAPTVTKWIDQAQA